MTEHHSSTLCISSTSPAFMCQPNFCRVLLNMIHQHFGTFLLQSHCPAHQACWPLVFWCNSLLPVCPIPSHHARTVQTHAGQWQSPVPRINFHHAPRQSIPLGCKVRGCQDHYHCFGMVQYSQNCPHREYFTTTLHSSCSAQQDPAPQDLQEHFTNYTQETFKHAMHKNNFTPQYRNSW